MTSIGTPLSADPTRVLLLGSGELGKEVVIELQRLGVEVVAVDRYANAPAMQVAHRSHAIDMRDAAALADVIDRERPDLVVPEIEAIATAKLVELEAAGYQVIPSANAVHRTMNREGIRRLAAEDLDVPTSAYRFASTEAEMRTAIEEVTMPCFVKPTMSSSGKGQSLVSSQDDVESAWTYAQSGARGGADAVIVEEKIAFDYEITLLTVQHRDGVAFCAPIGHRQQDGDYRESWQPQPVKETVLAKCTDMATRVTSALGGHGLFGVEFFIRGDDVWFSEVSPRPHDTGLVTLISQDLSEFALHTRAILGLPVPSIRQLGPAASSVILVEGRSNRVRFGNLHSALSERDTQLRLFGKPAVEGSRRMGVALALGESIEEARRKANRISQAVAVDPRAAVQRTN